MAYNRRQFAGAAPKTTLTNGPYTSVATSMTVASATGWPTGSVGPFCVTVNRGNATEEKILVLSQAAGTLTVSSRGYDGTSASVHQTGETVELTNSAVDLDEANQAVVALLGQPTTVGDMVSVSGTSPTTYQRVAAGSTGQVLQGGTPPSWTANPSVTSLTLSGGATAGFAAVSGLTGATTASRLVGGVNGAAPASGTFVTGDWVVDAAGGVWVCTAGGTPGTWVRSYLTQYSAKGDLLVGSGSKAASVVTVGANGTVPIADSAQSAGVRWGSNLKGDLWLARPSGAVSETFPRWFSGGASNLLTSGTLMLHAVPMRQGDVVTNVTYTSSAGATSPTHWWFVFADSGLVVRAVSADQTTTAWGNTTSKTLAMTSPYTVPSDGLYYTGIMMAAGTPISLIGTTTLNNTTNSIAPVLTGTSNTGQTTAPSTGTSLTALTASVSFVGYAYIT